MEFQKKSQTTRYVITLVLQCLCGAAVFFMAAGSLNVPRGIVYFVTYLTATLIGGLYLARIAPETLAARGTIGKNTRKWDTVFLALFVPLAYFIIYAAAALPARFGIPYPSPLVYWPGIALTVASSVVTVWSVGENRNFESSVRIQEDRHHAVCSTGPYAVVRHPGYTCLIVWAIAMPMMFGRYAGIVSACIIASLFVRTALEDAMLRRTLPGYADYARTVRYRLIPFIW